MTINDILVSPMRRISVAGGDVLHAIKKTDLGFNQFGEAYFSMIEKGLIKPWKRHLRMTLNLVVPLGEVRFVFVDDVGCKREEIIGLQKYSRLTVPPGIWFAFEGMAEPYSLILNVADIPHDPSEVERKELNEFSLRWSS